MQHYHSLADSNMASSSSTALEDMPSLSSNDSLGSSVETTEIALPTEILSRIIHFASLDSSLQTARSTLHALLLVSRTIYHHTVPHLYTYPLLDEAWRQDAFWRTIEQDEHRGRWWYVRSICLGERQRNGVDKTGPQGLSQRHHWSTVYLGEAIAAAGRSTNLSSPSSTPGGSGVTALVRGGKGGRSDHKWADAFGLTRPVQPSAALFPFLPIHTGPNPVLLSEVSWWEKSTFGGLLTGHHYSTRPVGPWCKTVEEERLRDQQRERASTTEDVDLGRGPGTLAGRLVNPGPGGESVFSSGLGGQHGRASTLSYEDQEAEAARQQRQEGLSAVSDDDIWAAAELFALNNAVAQAAITSRRKIDGLTSGCSTPRSADQPSGKATPRQSIAGPSSSGGGPTDWSRPPSRVHKSQLQSRMPWRYELITGALDPKLPKLFEAIGTLEEIHITLYPGALLDHDLLEHQLRILLTTPRLPLLTSLVVAIGHDAHSKTRESKLARLTHSKTIILAVEAVQDPRCTWKEADRTFGGWKGSGIGQAQDSGKDVRDGVVDGWIAGVDGRITPGQRPVPPSRGEYINGWLARDVEGTNAPIEE